MKKHLFFLIAILAITTTYSQNKKSSQKDKHPDDNFTYEKIKILDSKEGNLVITGGSTSRNKNSESTDSSNRISSSGIGETPGQLSVSLTGGALYDIPIKTPAGINGVKPQISLSYNSQNGNGIAGYGWNISGISSITRIASTKYHDDNIDAVDFDDLDRFALDGKRLVLKSGTYGADGAEYETEEFSNLKIVSHGTAFNGPSYFVVYYPDGSIAHYGNSEDSHTPTSYLVTYWQNPQGVRINYEYESTRWVSSGFTNSRRLKSIKYGGTGSLPPVFEIRFSYLWNFQGQSNRKEFAYIGNEYFDAGATISKIEIFRGETLLKHYQLNYNHTDLRYARLQTVQEYSGDGTLYHSPITFNYSNSGSGVDYNNITTDLGVTNIHQENAETISLDITGNGKMDFIVYPKNDKTKFWVFNDLQSGTLNTATTVYTNGVFDAIFPTKLINSNNKVISEQGLTVVQSPTNSQVIFKVYSKAPPSSGTPIGYFYNKTWNAPTYSYQNTPTNSIQKEIPKEYVSGDFNGDGLTDVLAIGKPYTNRYCYEYECPDGEDVIQKTIQQKDESDEDFKLRKQQIDSDSNQEMRRPPLDDGGGDGTCYSCNTYTVNYKGAYFIDLKKDVTPNFANYAGSFQQSLSGDYKLHTGDFNGDGKTDILHVTEGKLEVYTLNDNNQLSLLWDKNETGIHVDDPLLLGDYNGDGKTDFMDPSSNGSQWWTIYFSTGTDFYPEGHTRPFTYQKHIWNPNNGMYSGFNLIPLDINGDGKTDIVEYNTVTHNESTIPWIPTPEGIQTVKIYNNVGQDGNYLAYYEYGGTTQKTGNLKHYPIPIFLTSNSPNKNLEFASISNQWVTNFSFTHDHREDVLLRSINNNGVNYSIDYDNLEPPSEDNNYSQVYQSSYGTSYPYVDLEVALGTKVVSMLQRNSSNTTTLKQDYAYKGAVYNLQGLGFLGFEGVVKSNWYTNYSDRLYTVSKFDYSLRGAMTAEYSMASSYNFNVPTSNYINKTTYQNSSSLSSNKVFKQWVTSSLNQNALAGTNTNTTYLYDSYNNPTKITTDYLGYGSKIVDIVYNNNTGSNYYIGRPTNIIETSTVGSETFSTEQQFVYENHLLKDKKTKGNGTPFDIESYEYNTFGNITKKIITPNGESPREIEFEYDTSGLFLTKSIDVEDLETIYTNNTITGTLTTEIDPFGLETNYNYDAWYRLIKVTDYLEKELNTTFSESNYSYTVTNTGDDGSGTITIYDPLKRISKVKQKDVLGQWVSKSYLYDKFDRIWKESEPYTGSNPSQWNETEYDFYSRPIKLTKHTGKVINISYDGLSVTVNDGVKTVTSTMDAMGNTVSVTDPGGTINYSYYGNGNLKSTNYNGVVVTSEQDGWGRQTKLIDPSAGNYEYSYSGFGEITNEINPKGQTEYEYSPIGKLLKETITGDNNTNMVIDYVYNPTNKMLGSITLTNSDGNNSSYSYSYDSFNRLTTTTEINPYAQFTNDYTYDAFGRINTEQYYAKLLSNNKTSTKKVKNIYQNGSLKTIKDSNTNNTIWDLTGVNARGQLTSASLGSSMLESYLFDDYGYLTSSLVAKNNGQQSQVLMQLANDFNIQRGTLNSRTNSLFSWSETFEYDDLDRLITFNDNNGNNSHAYDDMGRITNNNTVGDYNYSGTSYQVSNIDLNNQGDLYYQQNTLQQIKYNAFKKPVEISEVNKEKIGFQYNAFKGRSHMFYGGTEDNISQRNNRKHYSFDGSMEISFDEESDSTLFVTYIGGDAYSAPVIWRSESTSFGGYADYYYLHRDYLGSILMITDSNGTIKEKRHFDAWGNTVKLTDGNDIALDKFKYLDRGYTGHEHLQGVNLIHMNGRIYDPKLKRFLSPDNFIQDPTNTQNFNRYSYVLNNPLMYVDPSGETSIDLISVSGENCNNCGSEGPTWGEQTLIGNLISNAYRALEGAQIGNWLEGIWEGVKDLQPGRWIKGWFKKKKAPLQTLESNAILTQDPMAGSSTYMSASYFGGVGSGGGGLGINGGNYKAWFGKQLGRLLGFNRGTTDGFIAGGASTWNFIKSLGTKQGWKDLGQGFVNLGHLGNQYSPEGAIMRAQMASSIDSYITNIPNMSAYEVGYDLGYGSEKIVEGIVLTRGAGLAVNGVRYGAITTGKIGKYGYIFAKHKPHHTFGRLGRLPHYQLNVWEYGVRGSGRTIFRIPTLPPR